MRKKLNSLEKLYEVSARTWSKNALRTFFNFFKISFQCKFLCNFIVLDKNDELLADIIGGFYH